jgi:transposase
VIVARTCLTDAQWERMAPLAPGKPGDPGASGKDDRRLVEAVLWIARTGAPWRDLPAELGNWNSVWRRFDRWAKKGVWRRVFEALQDPDLEWIILDSTVIRAHPHAAGAKKKRTAAGGKPIRPWGGAEAGSRPRFTVPSADSGFPPRSC